jgi:hypothetical protein
MRLNIFSIIFVKYYFCKLNSRKMKIKGLVERFLERSAIFSSFNVYEKSTWINF